MYRVYIAEDEPPILNNIVALIGNLDIGVEVAGTAINGRDALEDFKANEYDILLTDIKMPFVNGLELIEAVRRISPKTICIVLSGYSDFEYARTAIQLQAKDYLLKPVHPDKLTELFGKLVSELNQTQRENYTNTLNQILYGEAINQTSNDLSYYDNHLVVLINIGSFLEDVYNLSHEGTGYWNEFDETVINGLFGTDMDAYLLASKYPGERIIVLGSNREFNIDMVLPKLYKLHKHIMEDAVVVNMIYGDCLDDPQQIVSDVLSLNKKLYDKIVFGESAIFDDLEVSDQSNLHQKGIHLRGLKLTDKKSMRLIQKEISSIIKSYAGSKTRQKVLQYTLDQVMTTYFRQLGIKANDVVGTVTDYDKLDQRLFELIHNIETLSDPDGLTTSAVVVHKIALYIDNNYSAPIDYKMISQLFSYNEVYISSEFKKIRGISPGKYLTKVRIDHAKHLMEDGNNLLLKDIAEMVGYKDALYFSRVFKSVVGVSPSSYMKKN